MHLTEFISCVFGSLAEDYVDKTGMHWVVESPPSGDTDDSKAPH